jgi:hypothetical protein
VKYKSKEKKRNKKTREKRTGWSQQGNDRRGFGIERTTDDHIRKYRDRCGHVPMQNDATQLPYADFRAHQGTKGASPQPPVTPFTPSVVSFAIIPWAVPPTYPSLSPPPTHPTPPPRIGKHGGGRLGCAAGRRRVGGSCPGACDNHDPGIFIFYHETPTERYINT